MPPKHGHSDPGPSKPNKRQKTNSHAAATSRVTRSKASGSASAADPVANDETQAQLPNKTLSEKAEDSNESTPDDGLEDYFDTEDEPDVEEPITRGEWEIMPSDNDEPIEWKKNQPHRLKITFQHKKTKKTIDYTLPEPEDGFDFDDANHVRRLNRFRAKLCDRYLEYPKNTSRKWTRDEEDVVEIWHRKTALAFESYKFWCGKDVQIANFLNRFFMYRGDIFEVVGGKTRVVNMNHPRQKGSIENKQRSKSGKKLTSLMQAHELVKGIGWHADKYYHPDIEEQDLTLFRDDGEVILSDLDIQRLKKVSSGKQENATDRRRTHVDNAVEFKKTKKDNNQKVKPKKEKPVASGAPPPDPGDESDSSGLSDAPSSTPIPRPSESHGSPDDPTQGQELRNEHQDPRTGRFSVLRATLPHPESEYRWVHMPQNDDEAWLRHLDEDDRAGHDMGYVDALKGDFTTRFDKHGFPPNRPYGSQKDYQKKTLLNTSKWRRRDHYYQDDVDDEHDERGRRPNKERLEYRTPEAPGANALINSAIVPPLGYMGHVRRLVDQGLLPKVELDLHKESRLARGLMDGVHDHCFYSRGETVTYESDDEDAGSVSEEDDPMRSPPPTQSEFDGDVVYNWSKQARGRHREIISTRVAARDETVKKKVEALSSPHNEVWNDWIARIDLQTGLPYDLNAAEEMRTELEKPWNELEKYHERKKTRHLVYMDALAQLRLQSLLIKQNFHDEDPTRRYHVEGRMQDRIKFLEKIRKAPIRISGKVGEPDYRRPKSALGILVSNKPLYKMKKETHTGKFFINLRTEKEKYLILKTNGQQIGFEIEADGEKETNEFLIEDGEMVLDDEKFRLWSQEAWDKEKAAVERARKIERPLRGEPNEVAGQGGSERLFSNFVAGYIGRSQERQAHPLRRVSDNINLRFCQAGEAGAREEHLERAGISPEADVVVVKMKRLKKKKKGGDGEGKGKDRASRAPTPMDIDTDPARRDRTPTPDWLERRSAR